MIDAARIESTSQSPVFLIRVSIGYFILLLLYGIWRTSDNTALANCSSGLDVLFVTFFMFSAIDVKMLGVTYFAKSLSLIIAWVRLW